MVKKSSLKFRILSFMLAMLFLFNITTVGVIASETIEGIKSISDTINASKDNPPTSVDDIKIPTVTKNPYDVNVFVESFPIYNSAAFNWLSSGSRNYFGQYATHKYMPENSSPYYTTSIAPWYDYQFWIDRFDDMVIESTLPYREGRESIFLYENSESRSSMLNSELTLTSGGIYVRLINDLYGLSNPGYKEIADGGLSNVGLNTEQIYLRAGATLISGRGNVSALSYRSSGEVEDGNAKKLSIDVPVSEIDSWTIFYFDADNYINEPTTTMTDFYMTLIDDTSPSVKHIALTREEKEDHTAELVLNVQFNEKVRFAHEGVKNELDNIWIELELLDLSTNKRSTVRLYLQSLNGDGTLTFRGDIGLYNYKNFRVNRITKASFANKNRAVAHAIIDLADEMYTSAYDKMHYDNKISTTSTFGIYNAYFTTTAICDYAGNPINASSITNWSFGDQSYISNTFEAVDVKLYNERTVGLANGQEAEGDAERADMLAGPANEIFAYVYLDQYLTEEEASKVSIELNILDSSGKPLIAKCTSSTDYKIDELYGEGEAQEGTLLKFENISLNNGMTFDIAESKDTEPIIRVTKMMDEIDDKTAYANVVEPSNILYGDFSAPLVTLEKYGDITHESDLGSGKYYTASISINIQDVDNYSEVAGVLGTGADVYIGGGVDNDTAIKYILSESAVPPEEKSGYTSELTLHKNGMESAGKITLLNASTTHYLHLLIEGAEIYIDDLFVAVEAEDIVGNITEIDPPNTIDYLIDEIAPDVKFTSQSAIGTEGNTQMDVTIGVSASDRNTITGIYYYKASDNAGNDTPSWIPLVIEAGKEVTGKINLSYGGPDSENDRVYLDTLFLKAVDEYGNESEPIATYINLSLEKPSTAVSYEGNLNLVSAHHKITVTGAEASTFGDTAYTRVTLTPIDNPEYSYVTIVKTGEVVDLLSFVGREWYRVKTELDSYTEVSKPETISTDYELTDSSVLYGLLSYYGELKISFENGYGNMTPAVGYVYDMANAGSYADDPNYYVVRFASPYDTERVIHSVDFGEIVDRDGNTVVPDADEGNAPYKYNQSRKGINPMRNTQIRFSLSNIVNEDFGLIDFDYEKSYMEFIRVGENEEEDSVVASQYGLAQSASQFFTVKNETDSGEYYVTGAYYLKVTVVSLGGKSDTYTSSKLVLDAQTADTAGVWKYSYQTQADITSVSSESYIWVTKNAEDSVFETIGISVINNGEQMRSNVFAVYSYGVSGISLIFSSPDAEAEYEEISIGGVKGYKVWNLYSNPTEAEINSQPFQKDKADDNYFSRISGTSDIYTVDNIPKGTDGFDSLYLVKGINTICYQVAMENGYVSPVKQLTIIVTDYTPELNIAIDDYRPSHEASQIEGVVNAHSIRFFVETAYSLNGTGNVSVDLWSDYGMNIGSYVDGELTESFYNDPTTGSNGLGVLKTGMGIEDYADFTENSYTSNFPNYTELCTAVFVATDEYGGVTIVAPQIGDHIRYGTNYSSLDDVYNIDYSRYFEDRYTVGDSFTSMRIYYNEPVYFGSQLLRFENAVYKNDYPNETLIEVLIESNPELQYNLFNIVSNDISWSWLPNTNSASQSSAGIYYSYDKNFELINWDGATITFSGDDIAEPVTLLLSGEENTVGYAGMYLSEENGLALYVANPMASSDNPVGTTVTRNYTINCSNIYGDHYETSGSVMLYYIEYKTDSVVMNEYGASVYMTFEPIEGGRALRTGEFENGTYSIEVTDLYGNTRSYEYTITDSADPNTSISYSQYTDTAKPITVTLSRQDGTPIFVDINDYAVMSVENNNTAEVTVTVLESTRFSYRYLDSNKNEQMFYITVDNIKKPSPYLVWSYSEDDVTEAEDGTRYRYGSVTVYLVDNSFTLVDSYTGRAPSFTFIPGGESTYTFSKEDIKALLGDETVALDEDITATLDIKLYEPADPLGKAKEDKETPNVQLLAYSNLNGVYSEERLALQLENARHSLALTDYKGYNNLEFHGNRADTGELLEILGWSTSYRFVIETVDMNKTRIFIKQGLYAEAPDYETGVSDSIDGVTLNSKLLTITKNAKFSLFVVDSSNNCSSIAFDVTDVGDAPAPKIVKIPITNELVRAYIIQPDGAEEFEILGSTFVRTELDENSSYHGKYYVEYSDNDEYIINYRMIYNGKEVQSSVDISIDEINLREISLIGNVEWSANNVLEATNKDVSAALIFTENVKELYVNGAYDADIVSFIATANTVTVNYSANHPEISLGVVAENGSYFTVELGAVTNIDKSVPSLEIVKRELAPNGKSVELTISADERVITRDGGYAGQEIDGKYYFTRTITANGEYTFSFVDMTGLTNVISVEINEIVLEELTAQYSLSSDGSSPVSDASELEVMIGDVIYVKPLRDATAELSGGMTVTLPSDAWTEITIPDILGGIQPYIILTDEYGNVLTHQFSKIDVPDTTAPEVVISRAVYSIREGTERAEVEKELLKNFTAFDNEAGELELSVRFTDDLSIVGVSTIEYIATDEAGNTTVREGKLRVTSIYEPVVYYGDKKLSRDDGIIVSTDEDISLIVDCAGLSYRVVIKEGIRTVAQMKDGVTNITDYTLENEVSLGTLEKGIYTICIINQNRDFFRLIISVE